MMWKGHLAEEKKKLEDEAKDKEAENDADDLAEDTNAKKEIDFEEKFLM